MEPQTKKDHYREYLKEYSDIMAQVLNTDMYLEFLMKGQDLNQFDASLRDSVEAHIFRKTKRNIRNIKMKIHYREHMKMFGSMMMDMAECDDYVIKMIENKGLDKFEKALRWKIELILEET